MKPFTFFKDRGIPEPHYFEIELFESLEEAKLHAHALLLQSGSLEIEIWDGSVQYIANKSHEYPSLKGDL